MELTLKKVKVVKELSDETTCYYAEVWVNGKRAFSAQNEGRGGPDEFHPLTDEGKTLLKEVEAYAKSLPPYKYPSGNGLPEGELEYDLDMLIGDLLDKWDLDRGFRRMCKTSTLVQFPGYKEDEYSKMKTLYSPQVKETLIKKYPDIIIINERYL